MQNEGVWLRELQLIRKALQAIVVSLETASNERHALLAIETYKAGLMKKTDLGDLMASITQDQINLTRQDPGRQDEGGNGH